jgi:hypothetical protein
MQKWIDFFMTTVGSWVGHGIQGYVIAWVSDVYGADPVLAVAFTFYHFAVVEWRDWQKGAKDTAALIDGLMDFAFPLMGVALYWLLY